VSHRNLAVCVCVCVCVCVRLCVCVCVLVVVCFYEGGLSIVRSLRRSSIVPQSVGSNISSFVFGLASKHEKFWSRVNSSRNCCQGEFSALPLLWTILGCDVLSLDWLFVCVGRQGSRSV
jgi:hypothetical protein